jgi:DnaJ-class molecular chaperone
MDYYSVLGVSKSATEQDIRKAYKKKSMQHHPDRGGNEEEFKRVNEAYSTLKDPHKRTMYDHSQTAGQGGFHFNTGNMGGFEDIFANMFRQTNQQRTSRNPDISLRVNIDLEEVYTGKKIIVTYALRNGQEQNVNLDIPPGCKDGDRVRFTELGENIIPGPRGNLFVVIGVRPKPGWERADNHLYTSVDINSLELIVGTKTIVTLLTGRKIELRIPPNTKNGTTFSMPEMGLPDARGGRTGSLYVKVNSVTPTNLNDEQLTKIREIIDGIKTS